MRMELEVLEAPEAAKELESLSLQATWKLLYGYSHNASSAGSSRGEAVLAGGHDL